MDFKKLKLRHLQKHQEILDSIIQKNSDTMPSINTDLINAKVMAFITELGEFANARRIFKYWSKKEPATKDVQLEEFVDSLHFLLSINNQLGYKICEEEYNIQLETGQKYIKLLLDVISQAVIFADNITNSNFNLLMAKFLGLSIVFGFKPNDIYCAYLKKHSINVARQKENY